jgi:hypothetical protein
MLGYLIKTALNKLVPPVSEEQRLAENIIKKGKDDVVATLCLTQDEIYKSRYHEAKDLFHDSMKAGQLNREQILHIKYILRESLKDHREYYSTKYQNDAHEIYTLLKSPFLSNVEYNSIITTINRFIQ